MKNPRYHAIKHKVKDFNGHEAFEAAIHDCTDALMGAVESLDQIDFRVVAEAARYLMCLALANLYHMDGTPLIASPEHVDEFMKACDEAVRSQLAEFNDRRVAADVVGTLVPQAKGVH